MVDGQGRIMWGDQLMQILAAEVLGRHPGAPIIADVKASQALFDEIARLGGEPVMWKTGHSLIKAEMAEMAAPLAGEMSGHIFYGDRFYGHDDALYVAVRLLGILAGGERDASPTGATAWRRWSTRRRCASTARTSTKFGVIEEVRRGSRRRALRSTRSTACA